MRDRVLASNLRRIVFGLFFISGIAGLVYEIVWTRMLILIFGSTTFATSTVLAAFMGGLALGSYLFGKWIDKREDPLRVYALLELLTGLYALALPLILKGIAPVYVWIYRWFSLNFYALSGIRFVLCFILLIIPTILMGGTLPVLSKFMVRRRETVGINVGRLYALNTFGAVIGCFSAGFILLGGIGLFRTTLVAVSINILVAAIGWFLYKSAGDEAEEAVQRVEELNKAKIKVEGIEYSRRILLFVLWAFALSGFASLAYEVLWTRLLVFYLANSIYAFSMMLTVFLLGLALGSFIFSKFIRYRRDLLKIFIVAEIFIGITAVIGIPIFIRLGRIGVGLHLGIAPFWGKTFNAFVKTLAIMLVPTTLIGVVFPVVNTIYTNNIRVLGRKVGSAYCVNTIGAIFGSVFAGFLLIPLLGTKTSILLIASINILIGLSAWFFSYYKKNLIYLLTRVMTIVLAIFIIWRVVPIFASDKAFHEIFKMEKEAVLSYLEEGVGGTVTIEEFRTYRTISIDGVNVAGTNPAFHTTQKLQAHLALLLHNNPEKVLQVGFGSGGTAYSASRYDVEKLDCVEISPAVIEGAKYFEETNHNVLRDKRVQLIIDDARCFLLNSDKKYDVILSDSTHPTVAGNGTLYTVDYFKLCKKRLKKDGIFSTWLPLYNLRLVDYKTILRSLRQVFPYVYVWHTSVGRNEWSIVHGFQQEMKIDYGRLEKIMKNEKTKDDLAQIYIESPVQLLTLFMFGTDDIDEFIRGDDQLNTDDNAYVEFVASKNVENKSREQNFRETFPRFVIRRKPILKYLTYNGEPIEESSPIFTQFQISYDAISRILRGRLFELRNLYGLADREYQEALRIDSDNAIARNLLAISDQQKQEMLAALINEPEEPATYNDLGYFYFRQKNYHKAAENFEKAVAMKPDYTAAYNGLLLSRLYLGDYDVVVELTKRLEKTISTPSAQITVENIRAIVYDERRLKYTPEDVDLRITLADRYITIQDYENALERLKPALEIEPDNETLHRNLLYIYRVIGYYKKAIEVCKQLLEIDPYNIDAKKSLTELENNIANPFAFLVVNGNSAAKADVKSWDKKERKTYQIFQRAMNDWEERQYDKAVKKFEKVIQRDPKNKAGYLNALAIYEMRNDYNSAISLLEKARANLPEDKKISINLRRIQLLAKLNSEDADKEESYFLIGIFYSQDAQFEKGFDYFKKVEKINPNRPRLYTNIGSYYFFTGQYPEAEKYYRKAIELNPNEVEANQFLKILLDKYKPSGE